MSDEPKKPRSNGPAYVLATLAVLASYQVAHRETARYVVDEKLHTSLRRGHAVHDYTVPRWVEPIFRPAYWFDDLNNSSTETE